MPPSSGPCRILHILGSRSLCVEGLGGRTLAVPPSRQLRQWPGQAVYLIGSYRRWQLPHHTAYVPWENSSSSAIYKDPWCQYQSASSPPARKTKAQKRIGNVQSISDSKRCDRKWQLIIHLYLWKYPYWEPVRWLGEWGACHQCWRPGFDPWDQLGGRGELTPTGCPLTSSCGLWAHVCAYMH